MEIWTHRGRFSPYDPGNSLNNFIANYRLGVTGIEMDASFTADGRIIIYHPGSTYPDLSKMKWQDINNSIFSVMTLTEFLSLVRSYPKILCCLDLKHNSEKLVEKIISEISYRGLQDRIYLTAFDRKLNLSLVSTETSVKMLSHAKKIDETIKTHLIVSWPSNLPKLVAQYHPDMMSIGWLQEPKLMHIVSFPLFKLFVITRLFSHDIKTVQSMGVKVLAGIINDASSMNYFADMGVDGIMTDDAILGMKFKEEHEKKFCPE